MTEQASRFVLACEAFYSTKEDPVMEAFQRLLAERGLPLATRSDNGLPFASPNGLCNLSKLVARARRSARAHQTRHPQQNGRQPLLGNAGTMVRLFQAKTVEAAAGGRFILPSGLDDNVVND